MPNGKLVTWNGVPSSDIPELTIGQVSRELLGEHRGVFVDVPGRQGSWYMARPRGRRIITLDCFVEGATFPAGRRDAVSAVAEWVSLDGQGVLEISDMPDLFYNAVFTGNPVVDEWRELGKFPLEFTCDPFAYAITYSTVLASSLTNDPVSIGVSDLERRVLPEIELKPTNGTMTAFTFEMNGRSFIYSGGLIPVNTSFYINSIGQFASQGPTGDVNLVGAFDDSELRMAGVVGFFPYLVPGTQYFTLTRQGGTATSIDVTIRYRPSFRE